VREREREREREGERERLGWNSEASAAGIMRERYEFVRDMSS